MFIIRKRHLTTVPADRLEPGMILPEGVLVSVDKPRRKGGEVILHFAGGNSAWIGDDRTVEVCARLAPEIMEHIVR